MQIICPTVPVRWQQNLLQGIVLKASITLLICLQPQTSADLGSSRNSVLTAVAGQGSPPMLVVPGIHPLQGWAAGPPNSVAQG